MEVSQQTYSNWINSQYEKSFSYTNPFSAMSMLFAQSYEMLNTWLNENTDPNNELILHNSYVCALTWIDFRRRFLLGNSQAKLIVMQNLNRFAERISLYSKEHDVPTFDEWLDSLNRVGVDLQTDEPHREFFSVIVACYNDGRYKDGEYLDRLLISLTKQGLNKDEIEVILVDDCSPVPYNDLIDKYRNSLNIKTAKTSYNFAPGNTRQEGVNIAKGSWICFADHDDAFYPFALRRVKNFILEKKEKYYVYTPFNGVDVEGNVVTKYEDTMGWCHGKFYNLDNLWKPKGIHFIHDLPSHEDIAICTQVACALDSMKERTKLKYLPVVSYAWTNNPKSVSHSKYTLDDEGGTRDFLEVFFKDYISATGYIYLQLCKEGKILKSYACIRCIEVLCYAYFYTQGFQFARKDFLRENLAIAGSFLYDCKEMFDLASNEDVYNHVAADNGAMYKRIRPNADRGVHYVPQQGFLEWLDLIDYEYLKS